MAPAIQILDTVEKQAAADAAAADEADAAEQGGLAGLVAACFSKLSLVLTLELVSIRSAMLKGSFDSIPKFVMVCLFPSSKIRKLFLVSVVTDRPNRLVTVTRRFTA